jgi:hypothetical protein
VSPNRACPVGCSGLTFLFALILLIAPARSEAVPIVSLHPSNLGISSLIVNVVGDTIMLTEQWSSTDVGVLLISQLEPGVDYTVAKTITNSSGVTWTSPTRCWIRPGKLKMRSIRCHTRRSCRPGSRPRTTSTV